MQGFPRGLHRQQRLVVGEAQAGVDLEERDGAVGGEQELAGPGAHVADLLEDGLGRTTHLGFLLRRDERGRGLFH